MFKKTKEFFKDMFLRIEPSEDTHYIYLSFDFKQVVEYDVVILDPSPEDAAKVLNEKCSEGWEVMHSYAADRVILRRVSTKLIYPKRETNESK